MIANSSVSQNTRPWLWPVIVSAFLALLCVFLLFQILTAKPQSADATKMQSYNALQQEIQELDALSKQDPCAIAKALGEGLALPQSKASPTTPTEPDSKAEDVAKDPKAEDAAKDPKEDPKAEDVAEDPAVQVRTATQIENATVLVVGVNKNGDIAIGTGFFISPRLIVTNRHVIEDSTKHFITNKALGSIAPVVVKARSREEQRDYAVLEYSGALPKNIVALPLELGVAKTEKIHAWGYPTAVSKSDPQFLALLEGDSKAMPEVIYSEGVVSAILQRTPKLIAHTAPLSPGNSGGPLLNSKGHVVGINTMISLDDDSYRQTSLSLPSDDLLNFLQSVGVNPQIVAKENADE